MCFNCQVHYYYYCVCMMKYNEGRNKCRGSGLFTLNVVSEALNKVGTSIFFLCFFFFELQLYHHHVYSKNGLSGMFHRLSRYLLLKYVYLLCVFTFIWPLVWNPEELNTSHDCVWIFSWDRRSCFMPSAAWISDIS